MSGWQSSLHDLPRVPRGDGVSPPGTEPILYSGDHYGFSRGRPPTACPRCSGTGSVARDTATEARLSYRTSGATSTADVWYSDASERELRLDPFRYNEFERPMRALRRATYVDGAGAWYTASVQVRRDGAFSAEYDYDRKPDLPTPPSPRTWAADLMQFRGRRSTCRNGSGTTSESSMLGSCGHSSQGRAVPSGTSAVGTNRAVHVDCEKQFAAQARPSSSEPLGDAGSARSNS